MDKLKKIFFAFFALILTFILSATINDIINVEESTTIGVIWGFIAGGLFFNYYETLKEKFSR